MSKQVHSNKYQTFLMHLREARKKAHLSQAEVARRLGKPQSFVAKCESGERRIDAIEAMYFAQLYGVTVSALVDEIMESSNE
ncbi:MAG: helix-turn-helix transcriptional regulator [Armatimonadetes bacterium]|nr:helix-turn-helix transcriptional regulator [Armatimonadota bacterium]